MLLVFEKPAFVFRVRIFGLKFGDVTFLILRLTTITNMKYQYFFFFILATDDQ